MKNKYKIDGQTLIVYNRKDNKEMLFDAEDFDLVKQYTWRISSNGYVHNRNLELYAHRFIMNPPNDLMIDHKDHDKTNNRKSNLRIVTQQENNQNTIAKGYCWYKQTNKWKASITVNGKYKHLGYYDTEKEARVAYLEAKKKYHPTAPIKGY